MTTYPVGPATADPPPIDPLGPLVGTSYVDALVHVRASDGLGRRTRDTVRTRHFDLRHVGDRVHVEHRLIPTQVDDDLGGLLAEELFSPGWLRGSELFERVFTGLVRSLHPDPLVGWLHFYRNTLLRLDASATSPSQAPSPAPSLVTGHGGIAGYAPVYRHAESLVGPGSVLELGSCFGFLALRLAGHGHAVTASDVTPATMRLLGAVAPALGRDLRTVAADAARFPAPDRSADTVLAVHLLEHVDAATGDRILAEALRLARRRVIVAVPLEEVADETWGHVRTVGLDDLHAAGAASGAAYTVHEHHGGWLVLDV